MIIGIDIDSTITNTGAKTKECLKAFAPEFDDYHKLPKNKYEEFLDKYEGYIHKTCNLKPGVSEAFKYFKESGYKIIIITARNTTHCKNQKDITINYFKYHNLQYDKIIFDMSKKGVCAYENNVSIFIDDREENLDDVSQYGIECLHFSSDTHSKYKTFTDWRDIAEYIKTKKE